MDEEEINEMFQQMFADVMPMMMGGRGSFFGNGGGIPFSVIEAMLSGGLGAEFLDDEEEDDDEEYYDDEYPGGNMMENLAALMASSLHDFGVEMDSDDEDDEEILEMSGSELQRMIQQELLRGGEGLGQEFADVNLSDLLFMNAMQGMGSSLEQNHRSKNKTFKGSSIKPNSKTVREKKKNDKQSYSGSIKSDARTVKKWETDSSQSDDNQNSANQRAGASMTEAEAQAKKRSANAKKNKRKG